MRPNNPFLLSGYISPEFFCDRDEETKKISEALYNGRNIMLIAPRRMGKTGLIQNVFHNLNKKHKEIVTLYLDIYSTQKLSDFVKLFADTVLGRLDSSPEKTIKRLGKFIKSCQPSIEFDEITGNPKITVNIAPAQEENTLKEIFEYLKSSEKRCYIAIDEFQQVTDYPEKGIEALLRSYIQFIPNINWIFSGSRQHIMREIFMSAKRPFYQSSQSISIDSIDKAKYFSFAAGFFSKQGLVLNDELFYGLYDEFDGHTYYVQAVLNRIYGYNTEPNQQSVQRAIIEIIREWEYSYQTLLSASSPTSVRLLKAIAREKKVTYINAGEFISAHKLKAASSVNRALKSLIDKELVYHDKDGYSVYDRFMAIWLRSQSF